MSVQPPTDAPPPTSGPDGPPGAGWAPAPLSASGSANYAGMTSTGQPEQPRAAGGTEIARYAPKRTLGPLLIALIGIIVAVLVAYSALRPPTPNPSQSPTPTRTPTPSATPRVGTPFTVRATGASGVWQIADQRWDDQGLAILVRVTLDDGELTCYFNALPNNGQEVVRGETSGLNPAFPTGPIQTGSTVSGWVYFPIERSNTLVFLRTANQAQISGIEVAG
ncbi:hypothetical protein [Propionicimonas sp.]|uniref:hypothetical protein n=1 Tax=Propionicimonas sp. TaxID=1955623 RepID=UPI001855F957|nr:hypothetical protein [Propionicimonas sp.]MBU3976006.1 hypothetical protein [Actinomycetota bacterium]MBA3020820.1 hypothetical protein [Propionicimonas sp.]MBU3985196.1 hypothetical protein [Actinomycetota bacterium]MBU4008186.1 hypothetical protein [Actinomycetota bacterium]MBU4064600.1 hypothetical protein [Actinomycetota bacterium]